MTEAYRLTDAVGPFEAGVVLEVTARYGDWHVDDMELQPRTKTRGGTLRVRSREQGFTEREILDPTARIGDWQVYDCAFDPGAESARLTVAKLQTVAEPVETPVSDGVTTS